LEFTFITLKRTFQTGTVRFRPGDNGGCVQFLVSHTSFRELPGFCADAAGAGGEGCPEEMWFLAKRRQ
jgi:hypothetical protein